MYQITPSIRNWGVMPLDRLKCPAALRKARHVNGGHAYATVAAWPHAKNLASSTNIQLFSTGEPSARAGKGQGDGVRRATRQHQHRVSRAGVAVSRDPGTDPTPAVRRESRRGARCQAAGEAEIRTGCESSLARSDPESATETGVKGGGSGGAGIVGPALRFALNVPPFGLHRASLRAGPTMNTNKKTEKQKRGHFYRGKTGDISIEL